MKQYYHLCHYKMLDTVKPVLRGHLWDTEKCFIHQSLSWSVYRTITLHFLGVIFWSDIIVNGKASYNMKGAYLNLL
jgi:hypothetical protein